MLTQSYQMPVELIVTNDLNDEIAKLRWEAGAVVVESVLPRVASSFHRWAMEGLVTWNSGEEPVLRRIAPTRPAFLVALADYLKRQFSFNVDVRYHRPRT